MITSQCYSITVSQHPNITTLQFWTNLGAKWPARRGASFERVPARKTNIDNLTDKKEMNAITMTIIKMKL